MIYPIAETFYSIQGEGFWTGTPMFFIRLAGCNVGRYDTPQPKLAEKAISLGVSTDKLLVLEGRHSFCTTYDGQRFLCDTDYHRTVEMSVSQLVTLPQTMYKTDVEHVCITGGEPFLHNLEPLVEALQKKAFTVHIETSGTKPINFDEDSLITGSLLWITCCPKRDLLPSIFKQADEWKILVGPDFNREEFEDLLTKVNDNVYLQPINGVEHLEQENIKRCLTLLQEFPQCKLSVQMHKVLGVR